MKVDIKKCRYCTLDFIPKYTGQTECSVPCKKHYKAVEAKAKAGGKMKLNRNKYNSKSTQYNGSNYDSKKEADYAKQLDWRVKAKEVKSWSRQHKFELVVNDEKISNYYIDFRVELKDGSIEYVEVKGFETDLWRLKWRITKAIFHDLTKGEKAKLILVK